ncbi:hypothetical protein B0H11DRAFT_2274139 [Mycena galericulata]|nr:hypothetical protein B0H11DRAFT_2274139 [Mycena galericulata]
MSTSTLAVLAAAARTAVQALTKEPCDGDTLLVFKIDHHSAEFLTLCARGRAALKARLRIDLELGLGMGRFDPNTILLPLEDSIILELEAFYQNNHPVSYLLAVVGKLDADPNMDRVYDWIGCSVDEIVTAVKTAASTLPPTTTSPSQTILPPTPRTDVILAYIL